MTPGCNRKSHIFRIFAPETHKTFHPSVRQHKHIPIIFTYVKTRITATLPGVPARTVCQCAGYLLHHQGRTGLLAHFERTIYRQPGHASYAGNAYLCAQLPARHRTNPLLGKDFKKEQWLQLPVTVVFSAFIDLSMWSLGFVHPTDYFWQIVALLVGCAILGFGVSLEVVGNVVMLGGEAFVSALSRITKKEFGLMKVCFDTSLMLLACLISLLMFGSIEGVREGTVIAALLVGFFARVFNRRLNGLRRWVSAEDDIPRPRRTSTDEYPVITIAREYGSGGREIGRRVAKDLGFAFYDKELIDLVAQENHLKPDVVERKEQNLSSTLLYELVMQDFTAPIERSLSFDDALFVAQSRVIRRLAAQGPCVIVGRCADYVLQDHRRCFNVFIHASTDAKFDRAVTEYRDSGGEAMDKLRRVDKARAGHYRAYTGRTWNDATNYDLTLDSSFWGIEGSCRLLEEAVKEKLA